EQDSLEPQGKMLAGAGIFQTAAPCVRAQCTIVLQVRPTMLTPVSAHQFQRKSQVAAKNARLGSPVIAWQAYGGSRTLGPSFAPILAGLEQ
ncbi:MAG: hypothetical protein ACE37N_12335, partial [Pseudohongiellaceae bacterium]